MENNLVERLKFESEREREITDLSMQLICSKLKIHCAIEELIKSMDYSAMNHKFTHLIVTEQCKKKKYQF